MRQPNRLGLLNTPNAEGKSLPTCEIPRYDTKQSDGEAQGILQFWGQRTIPLFPLLPGPLWPEIVAPDRVLAMSEIELIELNCVQTNDLC